MSVIWRFHCTYWIVYLILTAQNIPYLASDIGWHARVSIAYLWEHFLGKCQNLFNKWQIQPEVFTCQEKKSYFKYKIDVEICIENTRYSCAVFESTCKSNTSKHWLHIEKTTNSSCICCENNFELQQIHPYVSVI